MQDARDDEAVLLDAIARAELEGRRTVADALARALGALRNVRAAGNVVALDTVRPKLKQGP